MEHKQQQQQRASTQTTQWLKTRNVYFTCWNLNCFCTHRTSCCIAVFHFIYLLFFLSSVSDACIYRCCVSKQRASFNEIKEEKKNKHCMMYLSLTARPEVNASGFAFVFRLSLSVCAVCMVVFFFLSVSFIYVYMILNWLKVRIPGLMLIVILLMLN